MTPRNPLDDKVIIDRETMQFLLQWASSALGRTDLSTLSAHHHREGEKHVEAAKRALAQDNTEWAAVPVNLQENMYEAMQRASDQQKVQEGFKLECQKGHYNYAWFLIREAQHAAMLAASPPLEQCKIPEKMK